MPLPDRLLLLLLLLAAQPTAAFIVSLSSNKLEHSIPPTLRFHSATEQSFSMDASKAFCTHLRCKGLLLDLEQLKQENFR